MHKLTGKANRYGRTDEPTLILEKLRFNYIIPNKTTIYIPLLTCQKTSTLRS